jgi:hypothetical protein
MNLSVTKASSKYGHQIFWTSMNMILVVKVSMALKVSSRTPLGRKKRRILEKTENLRRWNRFHRLAWGGIDNNRPHGVIAAGMENGELALWDAEKLIGQAE